MPNPIARAWQRLTGGESKASRRSGSLAAMVGPGDAQWTPRDYSKLAREGYMTAVWVFACVQEITRAAKSVPVYALQTDRQGNEQELDANHPLTRLLNRPNPWHAWPAFLESELAYRLLAGNSYTERVGRAGIKGELYQLRPDRVRVVLDRKGYPAAYVWDAGGGSKPVEYPAKSVLHVKTFHPLDDHYGMSAIEAAARGVDMFNAGMGHNTALLQNMARPPGALVSEGQLTDAQFDRLKLEIDRMVDMSDRRGRPMLLEAGLKWVELGLSPKDLDFDKALTAAARQVHAAFGVHPVLTGLQDGTYENQDQAFRQLLSRVALPLLEHYLAELSHWLAPIFGEGLRIAANKEAVDALSEDRDKLWKRLTAAKVNGIITTNEARAEIGYDAITGGDQLDQGLAGAIADPNPPPSSSGKSDTPELEAPKAHPDPLVEEAKAQRWRNFDANARKFEQAIARETSKAMRAELDDLIAQVEGQSLDGLQATIDKTITGARLRKSLRESLLATMLAFGRATRDSLLKGTTPDEAKAANARGVFGIKFEEVLAWAENVAAKHVVSITNTTRDHIRGMVVDAIDSGRSIDALKRDLEELKLDPIIPNRSRVIARTETVSAANTGSHYAAKATGLKLDKEWLATRDGRTRRAHAVADGQTTALDDKFDVGGELLDHPGDIAGSPRNVIQCRCTTIYSEPD